jgi:TolB-like protein/Flp pilus assembly protein TadD
MSFLGEIKRRKVFQVAAVYLVVAWLIMQVVDVVNEPLSLPDWFDTVAIMLLAIGFPVAIILSWAFDITRGGVERTGPAGSEPAETMPAKTGVAVNLAVIGGLALLVVLVGLYVFLRGELVATTADTEARRSIAVLPLDNLSPDPQHAFFADAIHGEILTQLAKIGSLKVISQTSVMEYRDSPKNMREIGAELRVATILEGGVQRLGDNVRINVQLIDAATDEHLWAETYDRALSAENIFAIQSEMATAIAEALQATLSPAEVARLNERPTQNTRAYDFYLSGNGYYAQSDQIATIELAVDMYQRAVDEDPLFALAHARLSIAHSVVYWYSIDRTETRRELALAALERARDIRSGLPDVLLATAIYYYRAFRDYERALAELVELESAMPGNSELYETRALIHRRLAHWDQSIADMERAIEFDPRNTLLMTEQARTFLYQRDYDEAERVLARVLAFAPDNATAQLIDEQIQFFTGGELPSLSVLDGLPTALEDYGIWLQWTNEIYARDFMAAIDLLDAWERETVETVSEYAPKASLYGVTLVLSGRGDEAVTYLRDARAQIDTALASNVDDPRLHIALGEVLAGLGETDAAIAAAREGMALLETSRDALWGPAHRKNAIFRVFLPAGAHDLAIEELGLYFEGPGLWSIEGLLPDPKLDPIRDDPRFQALVDEYERQ